ncbi:hypothetical protein BU23DRAFT_27885 [Bimuria novae-zelandiae CBS 107.79]|uniref:Zn(2)-C6 fungal-type domain-containing protein n=1 Tax=Bimuria novae-zelandiae CBS 107.79 TaxID=1447943 RepID=A0A6A5VH31_9PLEO|nr:hypothetical protein BU23DRAFT_27885 [Bimuria novae-zelandiae CBS 107.79]
MAPHARFPSLTSNLGSSSISHVSIQFSVQPPRARTPSHARAICQNTLVTILYPPKLPSLDIFTHYNFGTNPTTLPHTSPLPLPSHTTLHITTMNQATTVEATPLPSPNPSALHKPHNPYQRMSQRRAIACTICAKAKTKCDKAVPSCSRCTAKGLQCEPRSTRRTSDNSYRKPTKHLVSPKRFPTMGTSPRSIPSSGRPQIMRTVSQMDFHTAAKLSQYPTNFNNFNMLTPLPTYPTPVIEDSFSYSSSPEPNMGGFSRSMDQNGYITASRAMTPSTPEPFAFHDPIAIADPFDQYMNNSSWSDDGSMAVGLGFEHDIPGMLPSDMWATPEPESITPMGLCDSPTAMNNWSHSAMSVSPPQLPMGMTPHSKAVPSLSISETSSDEYNSPRRVQEEWNNIQPHAGQMMGKPMVTGTFMDSVKSFAYPKAPQPIWEDIIVPRTQTF